MVFCTEYIKVNTSVSPVNQGSFVIFLKNTFNVALDYNFSVYKKKWLCSEALLNDQAPHPIFKVNPRLSLGTDQKTKKSWIQAEFMAIGEGRTRYCVVNLQHPFHAQLSLPHNKSVQCLENL